MKRVINNTIYDLSNLPAKTLEAKPCGEWTKLVIESGKSIFTNLWVKLGIKQVKSLLSDAIYWTEITKADWTDVDPTNTPAMEEQKLKDWLWSFGVEPTPDNVETAQVALKANLGKDMFTVINEQTDLVKIAQERKKQVALAANLNAQLHRTPWQLVQKVSREKCLEIAATLPNKNVEELFANADKIAAWGEERRDL